MWELQLQLPKEEKPLRDSEQSQGQAHPLLQYKGWHSPYSGAYFQMGRSLIPSLTAVHTAVVPAPTAFMHSHSIAAP